MRLVKQFFIKKNDPRFKELDNTCFLAKNLYNSTLYAIRQHYFSTNEYLNYNTINKQFKENNQKDYRALPANVSQQVQQLVQQNYNSYFALLKLKQAGKYNKPVKLPKYLDKIKGRQIVVYTKRVISQKQLKKGILSLANIEAKFNIGIINNVQQVRLIPKLRGIMIEVVYTIPDPKLKQFNKNVASMDLGLNNLGTITSNVFDPFIINGKPLKSINHYYNKVLAELKSKKSNNKIKILTQKRNNKVKDYLHKSSRYLVNQLVSNNISLLVIGYNKGWKQDISIGKCNNQNFVQIPFLTFINMIQYKCRLVGIEVVLVNESHTSKCSFLDNEPIKHHKVYVGKRVKRGLFRTKDGLFVNADVNGSGNIMVKGLNAAGKKIKFDPVQVCGTPTVFTVKK